MVFRHPVSRQLEQWWKDHASNPADPAWLSFIEDYRSLLPAKLEEVTSEHSNLNASGQKCFGMSKAGGCTRSATLKALGYEPEPFSGSSLFTFFLGHSIEVLAIASLRACGYEVGAAQARCAIEPMMASASDGVLTLAGKPCILSVKSTGYKKALALDTEIPTPQGWRTMRDIQAGDEVFGAEGLPTRVTYKSEVFNNGDCYRVVFKDGSSVVCDGDHLWQVETETDIAYNSQIPFWERRGYKKDPRPQRIMSTRDMAATNELIRIIVAAPVERPEQVLPVDPYVLGAWLGDGTIGSPVLVCANGDAEILDEIERRGIHVERKDHIAHRLGEPGDGRGKHNSWMDSMRELGLTEKKFIPSPYMEASVQQRMDLLKGLMDTDGHARMNGGCLFTNTNRELIDQVRELLGSLGVRASVSEHRATLNGIDHGAYFHLSFTASFPVFSLVRKLERQRKGTVKSRSRYVRSVQPVPPVPTQCIKVANKDGLFLVTRDYIVTHNSGMERGKPVRRGFPELPFEGVRKAQPSWWAQAQGEMHATGIKQTLVLAVAKDIIKSMEADPYLMGPEGNGSLTFFAQLIPYDKDFCVNHLVPVWMLAWDAKEQKRPGPAYFLNGGKAFDGKNHEYVSLDVASTSWTPNAARTGTFNPCSYCDMSAACKSVS